MSEPFKILKWKIIKWQGQYTLFILQMNTCESDAIYRLI